MHICCDQPGCTVSVCVRHCPQVANIEEDQRVQWLENIDFVYVNCHFKANLSKKHSLPYTVNQLVLALFSSANSCLQGFFKKGTKECAFAN